MSYIIKVKPTYNKMAKQTQDGGLSHEIIPKKRVYLLLLQPNDLHNTGIDFYRHIYSAVKLFIVSILLVQ